jgi:hypothetical protein
MTTRTRICPECSTTFELTATKGKARVFCTEACKQTHANRRTTRGKSLVAIAMGWRQTRGSGQLGKDLFAEMTRMLDTFVAEDVAAGRMRSDDYAKTILDMGEFQDRRVSHVRCAEGHQGCHRSVGSTGANMSIAKRVAKARGWHVDGDRAVCPNCRDDNAI